MNKVYNNQLELASKLADFFLEISPNIKKTQIKVIPYVVIGMILAESGVASDISKELKGDFSLVQHDSVVKRIRRLFKNKHFDPYSFYDDIIKHVISNYRKKHNDKRVHITLDHMFSHDNFTVLMISMRIGKQGIPLWFRCFDNNDDPKAFEESLLTEGISYVSSLFPKDFDLIFLADRWFNSTSLMSHINSLGHTFCFRLKKNIKALIYNEKEGHDVWYFLDEAKHYVHHANYFHNIKLTEKEYVCNLVIGPSKTKKNNYYTEPWIIATNGDPKRALKDYAYRFGSIECIFKNQKSNGFYLENTCNASLKYFQSLYTFVCISTLFLTILGTVFAKNDKPHKHVTITTHNKKSGPGKRRVLSLFNTGLTLFKRAYNSSVHIYIPFNFILYDV